MNNEELKLFESIFHRCFLDYPMEAAYYFLALSENEFGTPLNKLTQNSRISFERFARARKELLKQGYIAKMINLDEGENRYLPVNPRLVWETLKCNDKDNFNREEIERNDNILKNIESNYKKKILPSGLAVSHDDISIYYSGRWFFYTLVNNVEISSENASCKLMMMLGRLGSFKGHYLNFYENMLGQHKGLSLEILYSYPLDDRKTPDGENHLKGLILNLEQLKNRYPNRIEFYSSLVPHATTRRIIFEHSNGTPYLAIDARKILPINRQDPSYIGTTYFQFKDTSWLQKNFKESWEGTKRHYNNRSTSK